MKQGQVRSIVLASIGTLALVGMLVAAVLMLPARSANAQDATVAPVQVLPRTITVVGEGQVKVEPDIARINIGVEVIRPTVREASDANEELLSGVLTALQAAGVAEDDIQTSGFTVFSERFGPNGQLPEDEVTYRVSNNVMVVVRDLANIGAILDAAIEAGANNIYGVEFALDNTDTVESEARGVAIADAKTKADELAALSGVGLGAVVSVSEVLSQNLPYAQFRESAVGMGGGGPTIQPGQVTLTMQLQVVYEITQ